MMKIKKEITYPDDFFCFKEGVKISEEEINKWINECLEKVVKEKKESYMVASGDTEVSVTINEEDEITINVNHG